MPPHMRKALSLISGGLDSILATKAIMNQGIHVEGINFFTGFAGDHCHCFKILDGDPMNAKWACDKLGIKLHVVNVIDEFKSVLIKPEHGYGANLNPCLDCKLFMITKAHAWALEHGFDFLITGEVIGQRPNSQRRDTLPLAVKITDDRIVRPLCAKLLKATLPEREGWIDREKLYDFNGRGRSQQIKLAAQFGFTQFPQPAGGCVLTDKNFCRRLKDLLDHRIDKNYSIDDALLLRIGRHIRINPNLKIIAGRNETENNFILDYKDKYVLLESTSHDGAVLLLDGIIDAPSLEFSKRLTAYFSKGRECDQVTVQNLTDLNQTIVKPLIKEDFINFLV